jgi:hypothetical protein
MDELKKIAGYFFQRKGVSDTCDRMAFLLSHFNLLHSESLCYIELPDLFHIKLENEGVTECFALVLVLNQGKTNQFGIIEITGCIRNKEVEVCLIGALGFYLFSHFHITKEPFPQFNKSEDWYDIKLCPSRNNIREAIRYETQLSAINRCFREVGIRSSKKTS